MKQYFYLIDFGTGSTRIALADSDGKFLSIKSYQNEYYVDNNYENAQYFIPEEWKRNILEGMQSLADEFPEIRVSAITSAGARQSFVLLDQSGEAIYGLPNIDNRGEEYMDSVTEREEIYKISGKWVTADFGAAKIMGFQKKYPDKMRNVYKFTSISEWMAQIFTGKIVIEPSQACESELYDIDNKRWSKEICNVYGINPDVLPEIKYSGTAIGKIKENYISCFHMKYDAVFLIGGADTQMALKSGEIKPGDIAVVSGTTSPVAVLMDHKFYDEQQRVWTDLYIKESSYVVEMNPGVTGLNYQILKEKLFPGYSYDELEDIYRKKETFECTASFTSLLFQKHKSLKNGGIFMRSPVSSEFDATDIIWAVLADIACATYEQFCLLRQITGNTSESVLGMGGGFRSEALCQMEADLYQMPLVLPEGYEQATLYGLVHLCKEYFGIAAEPEFSGQKKYIPEKRSLIQEYYPVWKKNREFVNRL